MTLGYGGIWAFVFGMLVWNVGIFCSHKLMKSGMWIAGAGFFFACLITMMSTTIDPTVSLFHTDTSNMLAMLFNKYHNETVRTLPRIVFRV